MISLICYKINAWTTSNHMAVFVFVHDPKKASINAFWTFIKSFFVRLISYRCRDDVTTWNKHWDSLDYRMDNGKVKESIC